MEINWSIGLIVVLHKKIRVGYCSWVNSGRTSTWNWASNLAPALELVVPGTHGNDCNSTPAVLARQLTGGPIQDCVEMKSKKENSKWNSQSPFGRDCDVCGPSMTIGAARSKRRRFPLKPLWLLRFQRWNSGTICCCEPSALDEILSRAPFEVVRHCRLPSLRMDRTATAASLLDWWGSDINYRRSYPGICNRIRKQRKKRLTHSFHLRRRSGM